jgi:hypothetical protein
MGSSYGPPGVRDQPHTPAQRREDNMNSPRLEYTAELLRHFADLRDGSHGGATSRREKERLFTAAVALLDPYARQPLEEINADLLLGTGEVTATGVRCHGTGLDAIWALSWPEQQAGAIQPVVIRAYYGVGAHHPHLQAGTAGDWPLNVFDEKQAAADFGVVRGTTTAPASIPRPDQTGLPPARCSSLAESPRSGIAYIVAVKSECNFTAKESEGGSRIPAGRR